MMKGIETIHDSTGAYIVHRPFIKVIANCILPVFGLMMVSIFDFSNGHERFVKFSIMKSTTFKWENEK